MKIVAFRVDASLEMGTGHVMRCLTLADELKRMRAKCTFITRAHPGNLADAIKERGYETVLLPKAQAAYQSRQDDVAHASWLGGSWEQDAEETGVAIGASRPDWLIVDHYGIDARWHKKLRGQVGKVMVIDDLADRSYSCDLLLDQNLGRKDSDYTNLVPDHCMILVGPKYALLRPEFAALREYSLQRRKNAKVHQVLITMGGVDQHNATGKVLDALERCPLPVDCLITVVMGQNAPWLEVVQQQAKTLPWRTEVLVNINDMAQRMADSDLAIGAAGATSWERCCMGLPAVVLVFADNQRDIAMHLQEAKAAIYIDFYADSLFTQLSDAIHALADNNRMQYLIEKSTNICDGLGVGRVLEAISEK